jgi:serine/threonine-protein kinase
MADVYDGVDTRLQRRVAVKRLRPVLAAEPAVRARFEREARAAARLNHPGVVAIFDIGEDAGVPYLVMERMPGETLADRMSRGPLDQAWLRHVVLQVLDALAAAHRVGILHRDIKPGNVLLGPDGAVKVADFGIAAIADRAPDEHRTSTGLVIGTPAYLAPERAQGRPATVRSDVYAVGVLLYEGLTGRKPYTGATPLATAVAAQAGDAPPVATLRPDADPGLAAAAARAMSLRPEDRFGSAGAMASAVTAALAGPKTLAGPPTLAGPQTLAGPPTLVLPAAAAEPRRRHGVARTVAALAGALALAVIVVILWPFGGQPAGPHTTTTPSTATPATTVTTVAAAPPTTSVAPVVLTPTTTREPKHRHRPPHGAPGGAGTNAG